MSEARRTWECPRYGEATQTACSTCNCTRGSTDKKHDTPRTDAAAHDSRSILGGYPVVTATFARQLERELAAMTALANSWKESYVEATPVSATAEKREFPYGEATVAASMPLPTHDQDVQKRSGGLLLYCHVYEARWAGLQSGAYCLQWNRLSPEIQEQWEALAGNIATECARRAPRAPADESTKP